MEEQTQAEEEIEAMPEPVADSEEESLAAAITVSFNEPQPEPQPEPSTSSALATVGSHGTDLLTCVCCCELRQMYMLSCGHVSCEAYIKENVRVTGKRMCFMCKVEWAFY